MKNILVPTDFSPESRYALQAAVQLAQRTGGSVTLLHAIELPETADFSTYGGPVEGTDIPNGHRSTIDDVFVVQLLAATKRRMHGLVEEASRLAPGVPVQEIIQANRLGTAITQVVKSRSIDLVAMGAQGHTAAEHFFYGSNTERLVRTAPVPVLAVKHPVGAFDVQTVVFPSNFSAEADYAAPELRRLLATFSGAVLHLLTVVASAAQQEPARQRMAAFAQRHQLGDGYRAAAVVAASPSAGIPVYAQEIKADLIVLPTHGRTGLSRFLQASIAEKVATQAFPPVLTFQLPAGAEARRQPTSPGAAVLRNA